MAKIRWEGPCKVEPIDIVWNLPQSLALKGDFFRINCILEQFGEIVFSMIIRTIMLTILEKFGVYYYLG